MRNTLRKAILLAAGSAVLVSGGHRLAASDSGRKSAAGITLIRQSAAPLQSSQIIDIVVDATAYERMWDRERVVLEEFPLPEDVRVDLELARFDVAPADARFVVVDASGEREVDRPALRTFRGRVAGDARSVVVLSLFEGRITGSIRTGDGAFTVGPRGGADRLAVWPRAADPDAPDRPLCDADHLDHPDIRRAPRADASSSPFPAIDSDTLLTGRIAIDATFEWYDHFASLQAAETYILTLMAEVSTIYENEVNVRLEVPYLRVFTVPEDPYTGTTDAATLLGDLRAEWNANQTDVDRTVAHLFSVRPSGGSGIAYIDVLCHNNAQPGHSYDYGVSTLSAHGSSWEKELVAHELGHNFSSPHTHCYVPEIDQCANETGCYQGPIHETVGTIMSYCNATDPVFHQRVEDEKIRPAAEAATPSCMTAEPPQGDPPAPPQNLSVS